MVHLPLPHNYVTVSRESDQGFVFSTYGSMVPRDMGNLASMNRLEKFKVLHWLRTRRSLTIQQYFFSKYRSRLCHYNRVGRKISGNVPPISLSSSEIPICVAESSKKICHVEAAPPKIGTQVLTSSTIQGFSL